MLRRFFEGLLGPRRAPAPDTDAPVVVATCDSPLAADLVVAQLRDAGIPAAALGSDSATVFGVQSGLLAEVRVIVPAPYATEAMALLAETEEHSPSPATDDEFDEETPRS